MLLLVIEGRMTDRLTVRQIFILMILFSFMPIVSVIFTPAFPLLTKEFGLLSSQAQWVMTLYLLGTALGRLVYGPFANSIGRKKTLYLGLSISLVGTLLIVSSLLYSRMHWSIDSDAWRCFIS